jgi:fumarylacetoacetase
VTNATTDPGLGTWVPVPEGSDFPIQNLPFGVFTTAGDPGPRVGVAIGEHVLDLAAVQDSGVMRLPVAEMTRGPLNSLLAMGLGPVRRRVSELLTAGNDELSLLEDRGLVAMDDVEMVMPVEVGDYVDFYSSEQHATNVGRMFRPDAEPLPPNWKHLPIGYHGRSATIVPSGMDIVRPHGQVQSGGSDPEFGPTRRLDFEVEVGFVTGQGSRAGSPIPIVAAERHIAGLLLVNDWSARDIQSWEYRPLGPFLGKSFATTISPWLVTLEALAPYRVTPPAQDPEPLQYLRDESALGVDIHLDVAINGTVVSRAEFRDMYWTMAQQLAHATSNGAVTRPGDLFASGTVSNDHPGSYGSMLELAWNGTRPIRLGGGEERSFLSDGDEVVIRGWCGGDAGPRIGFGECRGTIVARPPTEIAPGAL